MAVFGIGCLGTALAYFFWQKSVQIIGADKASIYMNIIPLSAAMFSFLFNATLHVYHLIGGLFIIVGVFVSNKPSTL